MQDPLFGMQGLGVHWDMSRMPKRSGALVRLSSAYLLSSKGHEKWSGRHCATWYRMCAGSQRCAFRHAGVSADRTAASFGCA